MATKNEKHTEEVDAQSMVVEPTADGAGSFESAEGWVEPAEGTIIDGTLERAFLLPDQSEPGRFRVAFEYRAADGFLWAFGERAAIRRNLRSLTLGTRFHVEFQKKERILDRDGKPTMKSAWRCTFSRAAKLADGATVLDALKRDYTAKKAAGEDLPF